MKNIGYTIYGLFIGDLALLSFIYDANLASHSWFELAIIYAYIISFFIIGALFVIKWSQLSKASSFFISFAYFIFSFLVLIYDFYLWIPMALFYSIAGIWASKFGMKTDSNIVNLKSLLMNKQARRLVIYSSIIFSVAYWAMVFLL